MEKKLTVTVGIPAYQSENNIGRLLSSLLMQQQTDIVVEKILIYTDGCTDRTAEIVREFNEPTIRLYESKANHGYAQSLQFLIDKNKSQIFIGLNDDIIIESRTLLNDLVKPFLRNHNLGMVCGNIIALEAETFLAKCIYASYAVFQIMKQSYKDGNSAFTVDGKIIALQKSFSKKINLKDFPIGNTDVYMYFLCKKLSLDYKFIQNAEVIFRLPETVRDFKNQEERAKATYSLMQKYFGEEVQKEWGIPKKEYYLSILKAFLKYPIYSTAFKLIKLSLFLNKNPELKTWKIAKSTKNLVTKINMKSLLLFPVETLTQIFTDIRI